MRSSRSEFFDLKQSGDRQSIAYDAGSLPAGDSTIFALAIPPEHLGFVAEALQAIDSDVNRGRLMKDRVAFDLLPGEEPGQYNLFATRP